jgi:RNA polymerase sigma factor FliA
VNELVETHLHLVTHVVHQLAARFPRHVDRDELRGAGAAGLVDAAHRYDPTTGVPFARYASIRIRGAVLDATRSRDWATRRLRRDLREIEATTEQLEEKLSRRPDDAEVAAAMGTDESSSASVVRRL